MDPATAFQIACGAFDLVRVCYEVANTAYECYNSLDGLTDDKQKIRKSAQHMSAAVTSVKDSSTPLLQSANLDDIQKRLKITCEECIEYSAMLQTLLEGIKSKNERGVCDFIKALYRNYARANRVKKLQEKLAECRTRIYTDLMVKVSEQMNISDQTRQQMFSKIDVSISEQTTVSHQIMAILAKVDQNNTRASNDQFLQTLIDKLSYETIRDRESKIEDAYGQTFEWLFKTNEDVDKPWMSFVDWLVKGEDLYWVNGKAGSGKSTLMKFIAHHPLTMQSLKQWTGGHEPLMLRFFFWQAGHPMERSIQGMLRSYILQALQKFPQYAEEIAKALTDTTSVSELTHSLRFPIDWGFNRLQRLLLQLTLQISQHHCICFLMDGVDELEGSASDRQELIELVKKFPIAGRVKVLCSSRPEAPMSQAFRLCPQLQVHQLTVEDIQEYAWGRIKFHPNLEQYIQKQNMNKERFLKKLCTKADGVFLWISLAVKDLDQGLASYDTPRDLEQRLIKMESNLHSLFQQMLDRIEDVHKPRVSLFLGLLMRRSQGGGGQVSLLELAGATDWYDFPAHNSTQAQYNAKPVTEAEVDKLQSKLDELVLACNNQCCGLVYVSEGSYCAACTSTRLSRRDVLSKRGKDMQPLSRCVQHNWTCRLLGFVHRSAYEFLSSNSNAAGLSRRYLESGQRMDLCEIKAYSMSISLLALAAAERAARDLEASALNATRYKGKITISARMLLKLEQPFLRALWSLFEQSEDLDYLQKCAPLLRDMAIRLSPPVKRVVDSVPAYAGEDIDGRCYITRFACTRFHGPYAAVMLDLARVGASELFGELLVHYKEQNKSTLLEASLAAAILGCLRASEPLSQESTHQNLDLSWVTVKRCCHLILRLLALGASPNAPVPQGCMMPSVGGITCLNEYAVYLSDAHAHPSLWDFFCTCLLTKFCRVSRRLSHPICTSNLSSSLVTVICTRNAQLVPNMIKAFIDRGANVSHRAPHITRCRIKHMPSMPLHSTNQGILWLIRLSSPILSLLQKVREDCQRVSIDIDINIQAIGRQQLAPVPIAIAGVGVIPWYFAYWPYFHDLSEGDKTSLMSGMASFEEYGDVDSLQTALRTIYPLKFQSFAVDAGEGEVADGMTDPPWTWMLTKYQGEHYAPPPKYLTIAEGEILPSGFEITSSLLDDQIGRIPM